MAEIRPFDSGRQENGNYAARNGRLEVGPRSNRLALASRHSTSGTAARTAGRVRGDEGRWHRWFGDGQSFIVNVVHVALVKIGSQSMAAVGAGSDD